jgi:nitrite reductase (NADH) small subunit/3-phenylpropionate/trans-cinnamate dioxygenase ferredoxin subunit
MKHGFNLRSRHIVALRNIIVEFHSVCRVSELAEGEARMVSVADKLIAVFCHEGQYFAIDDTCPHMGDSLSRGYVEKGIVTCPWHAWRFRLSDGAWADNPRIKIGSYPVRVVDGEIQVQV